MLVGLGQQEQWVDPAPYFEKVVQGRRILVSMDANLSLSTKFDVTDHRRVDLPGASSLASALVVAGGGGARAWFGEILGRGRGVLGLTPRSPLWRAGDHKNRAFDVGLDEAVSATKNGEAMVLFEPDEWRAGVSAGALVTVGVVVAGLFGLGVWLRG